RPNAEPSGCGGRDVRWTSSPPLSPSPRKLVAVRQPPRPSLPTRAGRCERFAFLSPSDGTPPVCARSRRAAELRAEAAVDAAQTERDRSKDQSPKGGIQASTSTSDRRARDRQTSSRPWSSLVIGEMTCSAVRVPAEKPQGSERLRTLIG